MGVVKTHWSITVDAANVAIEPILHVRFSPWTDGNRSKLVGFALKFLYAMTSTPDTLSAAMRAVQALKGDISSHDLPAKNFSAYAKVIGEQDGADAAIRSLLNKTDGSFRLVGLVIQSINRELARRAAVYRYAQEGLAFLLSAEAR